MNLSESFLTALSALVANKLRAILTMLGIIIGVAAVITMVAIGTGSQEAVLQRIQSLGTNLLFISPGAARQGGTFVMQFGTSVRLKRVDSDALERGTTVVTDVVPEMSRNAQVKFENRNWNTRVIGTTPNYEHVRNVRSVLGRYFTNAEERAASKVCVIGATIVENLFQTVDPLGKDMRIQGQSFRVVGILETKGQTGFQNPDDQIIVPLTTAQRRLFGVDYLSQITTQVASSEESDAAMIEMEQVLRRLHKLRPDQDNDFTIRNQTDIVQTMQETQQTFTNLLAGIAAVSLLVGGIGIMNIMIVSVTERTKEIGVRKAIGARRKDIMTQFLIESVVLSMVGGCLGIGTGFLAAYISSVYGGINAIVSVGSVAMSFFFASLVGIFFGLYPAWKAAMANVIDALRYE